MPVKTRSIDERNALVEKYMHTALRVDRAWGSRSDDSIQDVIVELIQVIDRTDDSKLSESYLSESLRNFLCSKYRAGRNEPVVLSLDSLVDDASFDMEDQHAVNPEIEAINRESAAASTAFVAELLDKLPPRQRKVFALLIGLEGFEPTSQVEIARRLDIHRNTVRNDVAAATETLRAELALLGYGPATDVREVLARAA